MTIYYAGSTKGFYDSATHGDNMPDDAVEISKEMHQALLAGQSLGRHVGTDPKGKPVLTAAPPPTLDETKSDKVKALYAACSDAIKSGYTSSALGAKHTYPSGATDQTNMLGSVTDSLLPNIPDDWTTPFWCADDAGAWAMRDHTAAQIQQAGADGKAWVVECQQKLTGLVAQVQAAPTAAAVGGITWD